MSDDDQQLVDEISTSTETSNEMDEMDEWVVDIEGRLEDPDISHASRPSLDSNSSDCEEVPSIFGKWECWDDFGASFIPETKKWQLIACMTHWFDLNLKSYLEFMQGKLDLAWSYYHGVNEQFRTAENSKRFIEHLLVSSCFLIFVMVFTVDVHASYREVIMNEIVDQNSFPKRLTPKDFRNLVTFLKEDPLKKQIYTLTMKYQIPWFVLEAVYTKLSNIGNLLDIPIHKFALPFFPKYLKVNTPKVDGGTIPEGGFKHLLHIFHWSRSPDGKYLAEKTKFLCNFHIPSATELQLSRTDLVNDEVGSIDVSYSENKRLSGVLKLTPLHLYQYSTKLYEDLLIFEKNIYSYGNCRSPFMNYVACMTCLIKTEADVRVLRENGVIPSTTFDDKDVLHFVQELKNFIPNSRFMPNELFILEEEVMKHHKKSFNRVIGEFKKRYCSNTWVIISVIAAFLLFVLTFIQTLYGTLSYYKQ